MWLSRCGLPLLFCVSGLDWVSACCAGHTEPIMKSGCCSASMSTLLGWWFCGLDVLASRRPLSVSVSRAAYWTPSHEVLCHIFSMFVWVSCGWLPGHIIGIYSAHLSVQCPRLTVSSLVMATVIIFVWSVRFALLSVVRCHYEVPKTGIILKLQEWPQKYLAISAARLVMCHNYSVVCMLLHLLVKLWVKQWGCDLV